MNIKQAKQEIKNTVQAYLKKDEQGEYVIPSVRQRPLLLIGAPGIGKTQIMEQIARECGIGLVAYTITHHTRQSAVGLPLITEEEFEGKSYSITEYTMSEIIASIYRKMRETGLKEGILFIDEINCVSETLAPTMLQFLQCKTFGNQEIPKGWIIVAAGNPPEYNKSVRDFDMVTLDRVRYMSVEADLNVWKEYARAQHINDAILSYLELKPNHFYRVETDVDGMHFVTARGWEDLSNLMDAYKELSIPVTEEVVGEFLHHKDIAEDAAAFFELYHKYEDDYRIAEILEGRVPTQVYARLFDAAFDERLAVVNLLLQGLTNRLKEYGRLRYRTDTWFAFLKEYRKQIETTDNVETCYTTLVESLRQQYEEKLRAELLTKEDALRKKQLILDIEAAKEGLTSRMEPKEAFDLVRTPFTAQKDALEEMEASVKAELEHAFTFMEDAFQNGQEMVVFVTELTITPNAAMFLSEHEVEKYEIYKEQLLLGTRKAALLEELKK